jgi:phosphatidylserine decarboxylase
MPGQSKRFPLNLPFAFESRNEIFISTFVLICTILLAILFPSQIAFILLFLVGLIWVVLLRFFRDPARQIPPDEDVYLSPADGRIMVIDTVDESIFMNGQVKRIAIFMSLSNVHVNRSPMSGEVLLSRHVPGKFLQAFREEASQANEHHLIGIQDGANRILVKQIAGIMARRVVCRVHAGDHLNAGERLGIIKFGSRVEIFMPPGSIVKVQLGERVKAGESILARNSLPG